MNGTNQPSGGLLYSLVPLGQLEWEKATWLLAALSLLLRGLDHQYPSFPRGLCQRAILPPISENLTGSQPVDSRSVSKKEEKERGWW